MHIRYFSSFIIYISITLVRFNFTNPCFLAFILYIHITSFSPLISIILFLNCQFYQNFHFLDINFTSPKLNLFVCMCFGFHFIHCFYLTLHLSFPIIFNIFLPRCELLKNIHFGKPLFHGIIHNFPNPHIMQWINHCFKVGDCLQFMDSMTSFSHIQHCQVFHLLWSTYWLLIFQFHLSNPFIVWID